MAKLIIVCGLPGSGKTILATELSRKIGVACIQKDVIKESLYESLNFSTLEDSKLIGFPSVKVMLDLAESQLANDVDVIIEAPFNYPKDYFLFNKWKKKYNLEIFSVVCFIDRKTRKARFLKRERDKAHHDQQRNFDNLSDGENECDYLNMPGKQIRIETDKSVEIIVDNVIEKINNFNG